MIINSRPSWLQSKTTKSKKEFKLGMEVYPKILAVKKLRKEDYE